MKRLTLEEIGKLAGVSRATVSRVINNYPFIRPEIRTRVQEIIDQTGFRPNIIARSLVSNRSNIVGLVIPTVFQEVFTDPYFTSVIYGIAQGCNRNNLVLSLYLFHSLEEKHHVIQTVVGTGLVDGVIVTGDSRDFQILDSLLNSQMPFVMVGEEPERPDLSYVDTDNFSGAYMATEHLIELGHRRIGLIAAKNNRSSERRINGYKKALSDHQIEVDDQLIAYGNYSADSGYHAIREILPQKPEAIFAINDAMAMGCMRALREAKIRVPDDMSVVGFDDLPYALQTDPPLTTVRQPIQESGCEAVELLIKLLAQDEPQPISTILPNTLIVRGTTRAVQSQPFIE
jgi:DNA-binding LacI/PurR family transcriptional regulator